MLAPTLTAALVDDHQRQRRSEAADHHRRFPRRVRPNRHVRIAS